jgi:hypothetical protein
MRLRWVGDSRDYVKWDCIVENETSHFVFYVPMLRWSVDPTCKNPQVQNHFDQRKSLKQFEELFPERFAVFDSQMKEYSKSVADEYFQSVIEELARLQRSHKVLVFNDPDTGVEPASGAKDEHLRSEDLCSVWEALEPGGKLIVYQHASRNTSWRQKLLERTGRILNGKAGQISRLYFDEELAKDVCFLVLEKSES